MSLVGLTSAYVNTSLSRQIVYNMQVESLYLGYTKSWLSDML